MKKIIVMIIIFIFTFFNLCGSSFSASSSNIKRGWKFLTWGMSVDETNALLVKNGMEKMDFCGDRKIIYGSSLRHKEYFESNIIKCDEYYRVSEPYHSFRFYFINEKLEAVKIEYEEDNNAVFNQLKKNYPDGKIESGIFSYVDSNLIVHTGYSRSSHEIWYVNPKVKIIKSDMKRLEKQNKDKESEERAKKLF
jgi:hypothetical protein